MKTLEKQLKSYLQENIPARERRNKVKSIRNLLQKNHPAIQSVPLEVMEQIVDETIAYERYWRKILLNYPELRGQDYDTKKLVMQEKMLELGVAEMGYNENIQRKV